MSWNPNNQLTMVWSGSRLKPMCAGPGDSHCGTELARSTRKALGCECRPDPSDEWELTRVISTAWNGVMTWKQWHVWDWNIRHRNVTYNGQRSDRGRALILFEFDSKMSFLLRDRASWEPCIGKPLPSWPCPPPFNQTCKNHWYFVSLGQSSLTQASL